MTILDEATDAPAVGARLDGWVGRHDAGTHKGWPILSEMPDGWMLDRTAGTPLAGHAFVTDGRSVLRGGKRALLCIRKPQFQLNFEHPAKAEERLRISEMLAPPTEAAEFVFDASQARTVNELARQKFKHRLLADILVDLTICEIEGWCKREYINELRELLNGLGRDVVTPNVRAKRADTAPAIPD